MPDPREHFRQRGWLETVLRHIPGFRGYLEKEYRREADQLLRQWIADQLQRFRQRLQRLAQELTQQGQLDSLGQIQALTTRTDHLLARVQGAVHGYSGFFDLVQVTEETLDRVYEHDASVAQLAQELTVLCEPLTAQSPQWQERLNQLATRLDELHRHWDGRCQILQGLA